MKSVGGLLGEEAEEAADVGCLRDGISSRYLK